MNPYYLLFMLVVSLFACNGSDKQVAADLSKQLPSKPIHNFLAGTKWKSGGGACFVDNVDQLTLYIPAPPKEQEKPTIPRFPNFGHWLSFDSTSFSGHYSAQCGNDCSVSAQGDYTLLSDTTMQVLLKTISRRGYCGANIGRMDSTEVINATYVYTIKQDSNMLSLVRRK